jgi:hypothetical protein
MAGTTPEFANYCRALELERARRLLGEKRELNTDEVQQKLLQKMLLAALQESGRTYFNYDLWLEAISAVKAPTTPRSTQRTIQLLDTEVALRQQLVKSASDLLAQSPQDWELPSFPTLQRLEMGQAKPEQLSREVRSLASEQPAEAERALLANWLEWRATHRLRRLGLQAEAEGSPVLVPFAPRERNKKAKRLTAKLSQAQRDEFEQAQQAAMPVSEKACVYRFAKPKATLKTILAGILLIFWVVPLVVTPFLMPRRPPKDMVTNQPSGTIIYGSPDSAARSDDSQRSVSQAIAADLIFTALELTTKQKLGLLDQFKLWMALPPQQVEFLEGQLFPGPQSLRAIRTRREAAIDPKSVNPLDQEAACNLSLAWLKETRPIWEEELAQRPDWPTGPILKAFCQLDASVVMAWIGHDVETVKQVDALVFTDPIQRQRLTNYRAAARLAGVGNPPSSQKGVREILEEVQERVRTGNAKPGDEILLRAAGGEKNPNAAPQRQRDFLEFASQPEVMEILKPYSEQSLTRKANKKMPPLPPDVQEQLNRKWREWRLRRPSADRNQQFGPPTNKSLDQK